MWSYIAALALTVGSLYGAYTLGGNNERALITAEQQTAVANRRLADIAIHQLNATRIQATERALASVDRSAARRAEGVRHAIAASDLGHCPRNGGVRAALNVAILRTHPAGGGRLPAAGAAGPVPRTLPAPAPGRVDQRGGG
jgi:hypothetical protein